MDEVRVEVSGPVWTVILERPAKKNAVDRPTADALFAAFERFDADPSAAVAVLFGAGGTFCAGADLAAVASGERVNRVEWPGPGPMGPTRMQLNKPVIAAIAGHAVAGGLELALWCDLRVVEESAILGVFCRRWGVPLIDGGTVRLPRIVGLGRALDLILTGRSVDAKEALSMGLANRLVPNGSARIEAEALAHALAALPQRCLRSDRVSVYASLDQPYEHAMETELELGRETLMSGESTAGAARFVAGAGRHGGSGTYQNDSVASPIAAPSPK